MIADQRNKKHEDRAFEEYAKIPKYMVRIHLLNLYEQWIKESYSVDDVMESGDNYVIKFKKRLIIKR